MYHEGLPARERIVRVFEEHLVPVLEPRGFVFKPKPLEFHRKRGSDGLITFKTHEREHDGLQVPLVDET